MSQDNATQPLGISGIDGMTVKTPSSNAMGSDAMTVKTQSINSSTSVPSSDSQGTVLAGLETFTSIPTEELCGDALLSAAPRIKFNGKDVPGLAGIPLLSKLGQGGMGAVYFGVHPRLRQEVAVKVLPFPLMAQQPGMVERFFREAQIAAKVKSPHLVAVTDVNQEGGLFYQVMEYVSGKSAGAYLKQQKAAGLTGLDEATALDICIAASEGLAAAHAEGIVHRDVKPDNILIPKAKHADMLLFASSKLADLGLARNEESGQSLTGAQQALGTPGYMAPEQTMDAKKARKPADIFSMGAALYSLLGGRSPFAGSTTMEILMATVQQPHTPLTQFRSDITPATLELIDSCLVKEPEKRYVDGSALVEALKICRAAIQQPGATEQAIQQLSLLKQAPEAGARVLSATYVSPVLAARAPVKTAKSSSGKVVMVVVLLALLIGGGIAAKILSDKKDRELQAAAAQREKELKDAETARVAKEKSDELARQHEALLKEQKEQNEKKRVAAELVKAQELFRAQQDELAKAAALKETQLKKEGEMEARRELSNALSLALDAKRHGNWDQVAKVLEGPLKNLGSTAHPNRDAAETLLGLARAEIKKQTDYSDAMMEGKLRFTARDFPGSITAYKRAAAVKSDSKEASDALAQAYERLGHKYEAGLGTPKDDVEAFKNYLEAAKLGESGAQAKMGFLYERGIGVAVDNSEAVKWYRKSADQNEMHGENGLGWMYEHGLGVVKNEATAAKWYRLSADQGDMIAQCNLGHLYLKGDGVPKDLNEAKALLKKSADQGYLPAKHAVKMHGW